MRKNILTHFFTQFITFGIVTLFVGYIIMGNAPLKHMLPLYILFLGILGGIIHFSEKVSKSKNWHPVISILLVAVLGAIVGWLFQLVELRIHTWRTGSIFTAGLFADEFTKAYTYLFPTLVIGEFMRRLPNKYIVVTGVVSFASLLFWFYSGVDRSEIAPAQVQQSDKDHPNVIVILADDLGFHDLSMNGNQLIQTPNIDNIASSGVNFTRAYVTAPVCATSRAGMLTGRYQNRYGFEALPDPFPWVYRLRQEDFENEGNQREQYSWYKTSRINKRGIPASEITLGEILKKQGYATGLIGKWHLGMHPNYRPARHGFDYHYGFYNGASLYADIGDPTMEEAHLNQYLDDMQWQQLAYDIRENGVKQKVEGHPYQTTLFGNKAAEFIEKNKDDRFFLYAAFNAPHAPIQAPKKYYDELSHIEDHSQRVYYAMIKSLDDAVGTIIKKLQDLGLEENTIIYFTSDNGGATYTGLMNNAPFKGGKITHFEGGQVVPFCLQWKGQIPPQQVFEKPISLMDIFTTSAVAAKAELPKEKIDGVDLLPFVTDTLQNNSPHEILYSRSVYAKFIRKGDYKLVLNAKSNHHHLYDVKNDFREQNDLWDQLPAKVKELQIDLAEWEKELAPPLWETLSHVAVDVDGEVYYFPN
ncbi:MAG: arylsulfatase A-like enzyme [Granulosicoccus sp.]|jgi:arylsulfatase A-like enzyme